VARRSLLKPTEWDGERAKNNQERQLPEADLDFQGRPAGKSLARN